MTCLFKKVRTIIATILCISAMNVAAQSAEEVYDLYQKGMKSIEAKNYETAINDLTASLNIYEKVTDFEGIETIKESAEQALAQTYYVYGMDLYQEKNFDKALEQFKNAEDFAKNIGNNDITTKASTYVGRVYVSKSSAAFTEKQYDEAIIAAAEALKIDNENETAYLCRGRAYKEKGELDKMKTDLDKCIELTKDDKQKATTYSNAAKIASAAYMNAGTDAIKNKKYSEAISHLETAASYPEVNANTYYYLAMSYNALSKWNEAVTAANKALSSDLKDFSGIYLELGKAYEGLGKKNEACNAYKKVTTDQYKKVADYQMQNVLKCN